MALRSQVPKFGDWDNQGDVPYTVYFEKAKKGRKGKTDGQISVPSSDKGPSFQAAEEAQIRYVELPKFEQEKKMVQESSRTKQGSRDQVDLRKSSDVDDGPAIPKFGDWDDNDPTSGEGYTEVFNKARQDRHAGEGKSPMIKTENGNYFGQGIEKSKGCGCFPWSRK